jgi:hypothetical protein
MTSFVTDFETHAIWQGYVEDPTAKDFVARKARTIALSKVQGSCHKTSNNQPYSRVWKSLGDSIPELHCIAWRGLGNARKCQFEDFCEKERYESCSVQWTFAPETLWQQAEKGKFTCSEATTRFPRVSCFKKPTHSVPETWGCMYNVLAWSANDTRNGMRNQIPMQSRKAQKKLVSSDFAKILEHESSD